MRKKTVKRTAKTSSTSFNREETKFTFRILVEGKGDKILLLERSTGNRMLSILSDIRNYIPAANPNSVNLQNIIAR